MTHQRNEELGTQTHPPIRVAVIMGGVLPEQLALWRACNNGGYRVTVIGTDTSVYEGVWPWRPRKSDDIETVLLRPLPPRRVLVRGQVWWFYRGIAGALKKIQPDVIHVVAEPWGGLAIQALIARRLTRLSVPVCIHGCDNIYWHGSHAEQSLRRMILRRTLRNVNGFVSWNTEGIGLAQEAGLRSVPTAVIPAIVPDPRHFQPLPPGERRELRTALGLPPNDPVVGFVGRLTPEKGIEDLLCAIEDIGTPTPFLAVWGNGSLAPQVTAKVSGEGFRGRFFGPIGLLDTAKAYQACDVIAVPSRTTASWKEQFGRVLVEAMLTGTAVVGYRSGAIPEVLGDDGFLADEGDVSALRETIRYLIDNPSERAREAARARESALKRYDPSILSARMTAYWAEVMG